MELPDWVIKSGGKEHLPIPPIPSHPLPHWRMSPLSMRKLHPLPQTSSRPIPLQRDQPDFLPALDGGVISHPSLDSAPQTQWMLDVDWWDGARLNGRYSWDSEYSLRLHSRFPLNQEQSGRQSTSVEFQREAPFSFRGELGEAGPYNKTPKVLALSDGEYVTPLGGNFGWNYASFGHELRWDALEQWRFEWSEGWFLQQRVRAGFWYGNIWGGAGVGALGLGYEWKPLGLEFFAGAEASYSSSTGWAGAPWISLRWKKDGWGLELNSELSLDAHSSRTQESLRSEDLLGWDSTAPISGDVDASVFWSGGSLGPHLLFNLWTSWGHFALVENQRIVLESTPRSGGHGNISIPLGKGVIRWHGELGWRWDGRLLPWLIRVEYQRRSWEVDLSFGTQDVVKGSGIPGIREVVPIIELHSAVEFFDGWRTGARFAAQIPRGGFSVGVEFGWSDG